MADRWLNADECAVLLGCTKGGKPNRRYFLETFAVLPGFPKPLCVKAHRAWRESEVEEWAENQRRVSRAA